MGHIIYSRYKGDEDKRWHVVIGEAEGLPMNGQMIIKFATAEEAAHYQDILRWLSHDHPIWKEAIPLYSSKWNPATEQFERPDDETEVQRLLALRTQEFRRRPACVHEYYPVIESVVGHEGTAATLVNALHQAGLEIAWTT